jgi:adenine phosphoribosyltransferase
MEHYYPIKVAGLERKLPLCKLSEELSIAAFVLFGDVEMTVAAAEHLLKIAPPHDILITAEAKGIPLVHEMARQNRENTYIVARKTVKLYMKDVFSVELHSITTKQKQTLYIDTAEAEMMRGKNVLIVDDVISTGESLRAVEKLVSEAGGIIVGKMAILAEGDAKYRTDIQYLEYLPLLNSDGSVK